MTDNQSIEERRRKNRDKMRRWRAKHPEKWRALVARSYRRHTAKRLAKQKEWVKRDQAEHPEKYKEQAKRKRIKFRERMDAYNKRWYQQNKERKNAMAKINYAKTHCVVNDILISTRGRAKKLGRAFTLTKEWFRARIEAGVCEMTGIPFVFNRGHPHKPSIDRIDSSGDYTIENSRLVCLIYNRCKHDFTDDDVATFARAVVAAINRPQPRPAESTTTYRNQIGTQS